MPIKSISVGANKSVFKYLTTLHLPDEEESVHRIRRFVDQLKQQMPFGRGTEFHIV